VNALVLANKSYRLVIDNEMKNEILNCNEHNHYFYHINLGHIKVGYYHSSG